MSSSTGSSHNIHAWILQKLKHPEQAAVIKELWNFVMSKKFRNVDKLPAVVKICEIIADVFFEKETMTSAEFLQSSQYFYATVRF